MKEGEVLTLCSETAQVPYDPLKRSLFFYTRSRVFCRERVFLLTHSALAIGVKGVDGSNSLKDNKV